MTDDKKTALKAVDWIEELLDAYAEQDCCCATLRAHVAQGEHNQKCKLIRAGITDDRPDALPCVSCGKPSDTATPDGADMCWQCFAQFNAAEYDQLRARFTALLQRDYIITDIDEAIDPQRDLPAPNKTHPLDVSPFLVFKRNTELLDTLDCVLDWLGSEVFDDDEKNAHGSTQEERAENISDIIRTSIADIDKAPYPMFPPPGLKRVHELLDRIETQCKAVGRPVGGIDELKAIYTQTLTAQAVTDDDALGVSAEFTKWYRGKNDACPDEHMRSHEDKYQWYARGAYQGYTAGYNLAATRAPDAGLVKALEDAEIIIPLLIGDLVYMAGRMNESARFKEMTGAAQGVLDRIGEAIAAHKAAAPKACAAPEVAQKIETAPDTKDVLMLWIDGEWWFGHRAFDYWKVFGYPKDRGRPNPEFWRHQPPAPNSIKITAAK